jgi:hypothetical protein
MENSISVKDPTDQISKKDGAIEAIKEVPKAKIQCQNPECLLDGEMVLCSAPTSSRTTVNTTKHSHIKPPKATSSRVSKAKDHGQENTKKTETTSLIRLKRVSRQGTKGRQRRQPFPRQSKREINLSLAKRTLKSLEAPWACTCWSQCRFSMHWERRMIRTLGYLPVRPWETQVP